MLQNRPPDGSRAERDHGAGLRSTGPVTAADSAGTSRARTFDLASASIDSLLMSVSPSQQRMRAEDVAGAADRTTIWSLPIHTRALWPIGVAGRFQTRYI